MASSPARKGHGGDEASRSGDNKCKWCRERRRARCVKPPGASKCTRCESLGLLCVTPINPGFQEGHQVELTPGEYCRELMRPTSLHKTRLAVTQLLEDLSHLHLAGGQLPDQVLGVTRMVMLRARAANDLALLHSAVSINAVLHVDNSMASLTSEGDDDADADAASQRRQLVESLVVEGDECILRRRALDGVQEEGLAFARQVVHAGVSEVTCNELFQNAFFDVTDKEIKGLYYGLSVALVDDESKEALKALDEKVARQAFFEVVPRSPSGLCLFTATSDAPLVLVGRTGERLTARLRMDAGWPPDGSVTIVYVTLIGLRADELTAAEDLNESEGNPRQVARAPTGQEGGWQPLEQGRSEEKGWHELKQHERTYESLTTPGTLMFPEVVAEATENNEESVLDVGADGDDGDTWSLCSLFFEGFAAERESQRS